MTQKNKLSLFTSRDARLKAVKKSDKKRNLEFFAGELEIRQLLAISVTPSLSTINYGSDIQFTANSTSTSITDSDTIFWYYTTNESDSISWTYMGSSTAANVGFGLDSYATFNLTSASSYPDVASGYKIIAKNISYNSTPANNISTSNGTLNLDKANLTINPSNLTTNYGTIPTLQYSLTGFQLGQNATVVSGSPNLSTGGTVSSNIGTYYIAVDDAGNLSATNYNFTIGANGVLTINPVNLTITASNVSTQYGLGTTLNNSTGFSNGTLYNSDAIGSVNLTSTGSGATANVGSYAIVGSDAVLSSGNISNYNITYSNGSLSVTQANLTITASNVSTQYGLGTTLNNSTGFTNGTLYNTDAIGSVNLTSTGTANSSNVANYTIVASDAVFGTGNISNYNITYANGSLSVTKANLTVTANNANTTYNVTAYSGGNGVSYSGFVLGQDSTALSGTLVYNGDSQGAVNAGSYTITPSNLTSTNYDITFANGTLNVATAPLTITANGIIKTYGDSVTSQMGVQTTGYTVVGLQGSDSVTNVTLTSAGAANTAGAANYNITPSAANSTAISNYNITYTNGTLTVNPYNISVTANNQTKAYGEAVPALTFTNSPLVNGDTASVFSGSLATTATANSPGGYYPITIGTLAATPNYTISSFTNGTLSEAEQLTTVVTTASDTTDPYDNVVSLREAIAYGTTLTGNQSVTFDQGIFSANASTISLTQGVLTINDITGVLSIQGPLVASGNLLTVSGNNASGVFKVLTTASISNVTLANGTGANGTSPNLQGGAIYTNATLNLDRVSINNSTANLGGGLYVDGGSVTTTAGNIVNSIYVANSGALTVSGALNSLGVLDVNSGTATIDGGTIGATTNAGTLTATGGTFASVSSSGTSNLTAATVSGATTVTAGTFTANATLAAVTVSGGSATISNGTAGDVSASSALTVSGGTLATLTVTGNTTNFTGGTVTGLADITGGTFNSNGVIGTLAVSGVSISPTYVNLNAGSVNGNTVLGDFGILTNSGTLQNGTVSVNGGTYYLVNTAPEQPGPLNINGANAMVTVDTPVTGLISVTQSSVTEIRSSTGDLMVNGPNAGLSFNSDIIVVGNTTVSANASFTVPTTTTLSTLTQYDGTVTLNGNVSGLTSVYNGRLISSGTLANVTTFGGISNLTGGTAGNVSSSAALNASGAVLGTLTVTNGNANVSGGSVTGLANVTGGTLVSSRNLGSLNVGASGTANISAGTVGTTTNAGALNTSGGSIGATTTSGTLTATGGTFASLTTSGTTTLTSATISGAATVTGGAFSSTSSTLGSMAVNSGSATVTGGLINSNSVSGSGATAVTVTNYANSLQLGQLTTGSLNVNLTAGSLTQASGSNVIVSGASTLVASGNITLANNTNDFNSVSATGAAISLADNNAIALGAIVATSLSVNAGGAVTQTGAAVVSGNSNLVSTGAITFDNVNNNFYSTGNITANGGAVTIVNSNATVLGTISSSSLNVNSTGGNITQTDGGISVSGASNLVAAGNSVILTNQAGEVLGPNLFTYSQQLDNAAWTKSSPNPEYGPTVVADTVLAPDGTLTADQITYGAADINTNNILWQAPSYTRYSNYTFSAWLKKPSDEPSATVYLNYTDSSNSGAAQYLAVNLTDTWTRYSFSFTSGTGLTSLGSVFGRYTVANGTRVDAWGLQVTPGNSPSGYAVTTSTPQLSPIGSNGTGNQFNGTISVVAGDVSIINANATQLGTITANNLTLNSTGAISQTAPSSITNSTNLTSSGSITLNQGSNSLGNVTSNGALAVSAGTLTTLNATAGSVAISGTANVTGLTTTAVNLNQTGGTLGSLKVTGGTSNLTGGTVTGNANVTAGTLVSNVSLGTLTVGASGTANISAGTIGSTTNAGALNATGGTFGATTTSGTLTATGGTFASISSTGTTSLNGGGATVSGATTVTAGTFTANATLAAMTVSGGSATISNGTAGDVSASSALTVSGGTLATLTVTGNTTTVSGGSVTGLANVTGGTLVSSQNLGSLNVGASGTANISAGTVGTTTNAGALNTSGGSIGATTTSGTFTATGGTFASVDSSGTTSLTGATVSGASNVTAGAFTANATLAGLTIESGAAANLTGGSATSVFNRLNGTLASSANITGALTAYGTTTIRNDGVVGGTTTVGTPSGNFTSSGSLQQLFVNNGQANLSGGSAGATTVAGGTLTSAATLASLAVNSGSATISGGSVTGATSSAATLDVTGGTLANLTVTNGNTNVSGGSVTGLANVTGGTLVSSQNLGSLNVGASGTANISAGSIGATTTAGTLTATGGTFASVSSIGTSSLTGATVSGATTVTGGTLSANATLAAVTVSAGTANLTGGTAGDVSASSALNVSGGTLATLTVTGNTTTVSGGSVTGLANVTGGTLVSSQNLGSLNVGASGTANISAGTVGATTNAGALNASGGSFGATTTSGTLTSSGGAYASLDSSGTTSLTGGSVSGTTNISAGTFSTIPFAALSGTVNVSGGSATFGGTQSGALNVSGGSANVTSTIAGATAVSGTGSLLVSGSGTLGSTLSVSGGLANITTGATVTGLTSVSAGNLTTNGTLSGGLSTTGGAVNVSSTGTSAGSNLTLGTGSTLNASGASVTSYGRIASSSVSINNATLALDPSFTLADESAFTIISNTGGSPVSGIFNGLPEGSRITAGSNNLTISYQGGPGRNDVVLYRTGGLTTVVTTTADSIDPNDNLVSLREAVNYARLNAATTGVDQTVSFSLSYPATITLQSGADYGVIGVNQNSTLSITGPVVNTGNSVTVSGGGVTGIFSLATATNLSNLTLSGASTVHGGAIYNNATTSLNALTIQDNAATDGAGLYNAVNGSLTITNSTFANNTASTHGGAIDNNGGSITLSQTTIAFNSAANGGGIDNITGSVSLTNTVVANNTGSTSGPDILGSVNVNNSLIGNTSDASITGSNNQLDVNALLGSFNYYGGTTKVYPLLPGSPAIDSGTGSGVTDQRGVTVAGTADMGSFQSRGFSITNTGGTGQVAMIGDAFPTNLSLSVASAYSEPVQGGVISFTFTGGSNSTAFTPTSAVITGGANASAGGISIQAVANANYSNQTYTALGNATGANAAASYTLKNVGTPNSLSITGGNYQSGPLTGNFGQSLAINVKDSVGNNIPRQVVTFTPTTTTVGNTYGALLNVGGAGNGSVYTSQTDDSGNISVSFAGNGVGGKFQVQANATVSAIGGVRDLTTQLNNFTESSVGLNVQNGTAGRSFVNNVAAVLGNTTLAQTLVTSGNVRIKFLGYSGSDYLNPAGSATPSSGGTSNITFNYGSTGIGGDNNSQTGDGVYQLEVDYTGNQFANATLVTKAKFHRLFGDVNGDKVVDTLDYNVVIRPTVYGKFNITSGANTNGVGQVYTKDVTTVLRQRGRRVSYNVY